MKKLILIEKTMLLTRVAVHMDDELIGTYIDSNLEPDNQNKIIIGQVDQVVKNLNAAFIDYAVEKKGLLHLSQVPKAYGKICQGNRIPIQIIKQNEGEKGHKLTAKISIKGKYLICLPFECGISISKQIKSQKLRNRLKELLNEFAPCPYGFIVRTHAEHVDLKAIKEDAQNLIKRTNHLMQVKDNLAKGSVLYEEYPMYIQVVIESINEYDEVKIVCDDLKISETLQEVLKDYIEQGYLINMSYIDKKDDLFEVYDIQKKMNNLQSRKIWLKNGGNIIIEYTEALTVIDVNSAKATLSNNHRKAVNDLNQMAVKESILQILRRNLAGIIIIDLIEIANNEDKEATYLYARKLITQAQDKRTTVYPITELGLLQISRSKKYTSIPTKIFAPCTHCSNLSGELSNEYSAYLIEKKIQYVAYRTINKEITVKCTQALLDFFTEYKLVQLLENGYNIKINLIKMQEIIKSKFLCSYYKG